MNIRKTSLAAALGLATLTISSVNAATYVWTGAGADSNVLAADDNWTWDGVGAVTAPASANKLGTSSASDTIIFDSETATAMPTTNIDLVRISSAPVALPNFQLLNGSLDFNRAKNWGLGGTTFTIGDGDMTTTAQANFNGSGIILKDVLSPVTYAINADGTLKVNGSFTWTTGETAVVNLLGGSVNSTGAVLGGLTDNANNFISFQSDTSSFTAAYGGQFADFTAVTSQFGDSFKNDSGSGALRAFDNGSTFTVMVPEPSSFGFLAGMFGLTLVMLRRRAA